ncbi:AAA family ATPase [Acidianus manzaensis]|uniref:Endonuclease GajA/Old nuclease/RecF-like AAA domain-containing protein n=1 Tax=Acidianus manzaensis TaxID=282676 RepID=A0A1W6K327_9CREN|nr:AAA family ATPase [Acidianus manzaensis]ARM76929.1 hypothetical protein B6F84_13480 [Acidianus manzaensis]
MIKNIAIKKFRGLEFEGELKKFNFIIGKNGSGKTSFLESIFLSTLFLSDVSPVDLSSLVNYSLGSRGSILPSYSRLTSSEVDIDDQKVYFYKESEYTISVKVNENEVAKINLTFLPSLQSSVPVIQVEKTTSNSVKKIGNSVYLSTYFDKQEDKPRLFKAG